jgi:hypothetical protein
VKIYHTDTELIIEFEGLQKLWALRKKIVIPREKIGQMYWEQHFDGPAILSRRLLGTRTPFLYAGSFKIKGSWQFWYLKHPIGLFGIRAPKVLSIDTVNDYEFDNVRVSLDEAQANELIAWGDPHTKES